MSNKDLFTEAIADAKNIRQAALANAKVALEEALAPQLQLMLSTKLQEMNNADDNMEEGFYPDDTSDDTGAALEEDEDLGEDFDLSEILAELDEEYNDDFNVDGLFEAKDDDEEEETEEETEEKPKGEKKSKEDGIGDLTKDELVDLIKDVISSELEAEEYETPEDETDEEGERGISVSMEDDEIEDDDEVDLEELLAELAAMGDGNEDFMYEAKRKSKHERGETKKQEKEEHASGKEKKEMKEAIATINTLRNELNEVNLLNAKLLYVNKVFKAKNLNESQKLKVIAQFDKANTAKEAKAVFESISRAIVNDKKSTIKESLGFASKAAGVAPKKQIVQVDETMSRWQILAGITKY